jgi:hypothetical protein
VRRFFNGEERNPHAGLDFAVPAGTPIKTPANGKVILVALLLQWQHGVRRPWPGFHQHVLPHVEDRREAGQQLRRGEVVGKVGSTGRATGPHMHWNVSLNDARVDPAIFMRSSPEWPSRASPLPRLPHFNVGAGLPAICAIKARQNKTNKCIQHKISIKLLLSIPLNFFTACHPPPHWLGLRHENLQHPHPAPPTPQPLPGQRTTTRLNRVASPFHLVIVRQARFRPHTKGLLP